MSETPEGHMQQHLCTCAIDLNNDKLTIVHRDATNPIPWPEVRVIQQIHGDDAVYDIAPVALGERETPAREKERLILKYGRDVVESVYAGRAFTMEWFVPGWPIDPAKAKKKKRPDDRPKTPQFRKPDAEATDAMV